MMGGDLEDGEIEDEEIEDGADIVDALCPTGITKSRKKDNKKEVKVKNPASLNQFKMRMSGANRKKAENPKSKIVKDGVKKQMSTDFNTNFSNNDEAANTAIQYVYDDDDKQVRRRKRRYKIEEDERKESKRSKRSHGSLRWTSDDEALEMGQFPGSVHDNFEDDDDQLLYVRGASPVNRKSYSPSDFDYFDDPREFEGVHYEEFLESEDSDLEPENYMRSHRTSECGPKSGRQGNRRQFILGVGRGLTVKRSLSDQKEPVGNKGKRLVLKRQKKNSESVCMFYMQGKCQKGDECPYSHDALPPRKLELCKFYLMDCCAKKDKCLYMHSDFPCKFFHTGLKCFAGDRCKFSHGPLTEQMKAILLKHLETAPKEILGDFPRLSREGAAAMVYHKKSRGHKGIGPGSKKIPSLFEIDVPIPAQLRSSVSGDEQSPARRSTPMPDSDNASQKADVCIASHRPSIRQWDADDGARPEDTVNESRFSKSIRTSIDSILESEEREESRRPSSSYQRKEFSDYVKQNRKKTHQDTSEHTDETGGNSVSRHRRHRHKHKKSGDRGPGKRSKTSHRLTGHTSQSKTGLDDTVTSLLSLCSGGEEAMDITDDDGKFEADDFERKIGACTENPEISSVQESSTKENLKTDNSTGSCGTELDAIPMNLPKKQRELFLRIKQQQREAAESSSQGNTHIEAGKVDEKEHQPEENWYSSDEEGTSLTDLLKNLSKQKREDEPSKPRTPPPPVIGPSSLGSIKLSEIDISETVSKLLSSIQCQEPPETNSTQPTEETKDRRTVVQVTPPVPQARDPRLLSRESRSRSTNLSSMYMLSPNSYEMIRPDPRTSKRSNSTEERAVAHRTSIYSSLNLASSSVSHDCSVGGTDTNLSHTTTSQQHGITGLTTDNLKANVQPGTSTSTSVHGDTDLRGDVDLRRMLGLPFKPAPVHTPANEVAASLCSHPLMPYIIVPITIPTPDYSCLKFNLSESQVRRDPRLRKIFKMNSESSENPPPASSQPLSLPKRSQSNISRSDPRRRSVSVNPPTSSPQASSSQAYELPHTVTTGTTMPQNLMNIMHNPRVPGMMPMMPVMPMVPRMPMVPMMPNMSTMPNVLPFDPRLPRNPRNAPGLLGPAPLPMNYHPATPRYEDLEEGSSNSSDTGPRLYYNSGTVEMQVPQTANLHMPQNRVWHGNRGNYRFQPQQMDQHGSFTPPM